MKEKELSSADKCRRTKLRKKSVEELVNIILRKDDVERRLSKSVDTFKKLQVTNEKRIETLKDSISKSKLDTILSSEDVIDYGFSDSMPAEISLDNIKLTKEYLDKITSPIALAF